LIHCAFGVAQAAFGSAGDREQGIFADGDAFRLGDFFQLCGDVGHGDAAQIKTLTARENGGEYFLRLGGCKEKLHVWRRFFKRFKNGVEGLAREHVHFVDDVDFERPADRGVADIVA